jgi:hypothetical protein
MVDEDIRKACQSHNCERCTPLGKRSKRNSVRDGRFDTKEDCCKTRFGETGCPQSLRIKSEEDLAKHNTKVRKKTLEEMIKLTMMIEKEETERWQSVGRPKNDGYINGSHSGYGHALRDMRQWIDRIKQANGGMKV